MSPIQAALLGAIAAVSPVLVGATAGPSVNEAAVLPAVRIDNFSYTPSTLVVASGTTVTCPFFPSRTNPSATARLAFGTMAIAN